MTVIRPTHTLFGLPAALVLGVEGNEFEVRDGIVIANGQITIDAERVQDAIGAYNRSANQKRPVY